MAKFCGKCGTKLDVKTGLCPNCDTEKMSEGKKKNDLSLGKRIKRFFIKLFLILVLIMILVIGGICTLVHFDIVDAPVIEEFLEQIGLKKMNRDVPKQKEEVLYPDDYKVESIDAEEYFQKNSQILSEIDVNESKNVPTEEEVIVALEERGFVDCTVTTEYSMDGTYSEASEISNSSSVKHPIYQTYYISKNKEVWVVAVIDGVIMANPVSYNMQSSESQITVSESETVTSYDRATNKFYKTVPNSDVMIVKVVEKIDADTLDELTVEVLG